MTFLDLANRFLHSVTCRRGLITELGRRSNLSPQWWYCESAAGLANKLPPINLLLIRAQLTVLEAEQLLLDAQLLHGGKSERRWIKDSFRNLT